MYFRQSKNNLSYKHTYHNRLRSAGVNDLSRSGGGHPSVGGVVSSRWGWRRRLVGFLCGLKLNNFFLSLTLSLQAGFDG